MKEFKIDKYITLRLIGIKNKETIIYVDDEEFMQCKYLLLINPQEKRIQNEIRSIDEASELLSGELERKLKLADLGITPEEEFWGHCSNLQAWVENDYNVNIIHTNLAFPLLKKLAEKGVRKARAKLRETFIKIIEEKNLLKIMKFLEEGYFYFFSWEEFKDLYRIFSDTSKIRKSKINIKEILNYIRLFESFGGASRYYSEDRAPSYLSVDREPIKPRLKPIIPDIRTFLKEVKINYNVKKEKTEDILSRRFFVDRRYITLKELLREN
ncbi:hypothetical protein LCGC14_1707650 [marine sediment metagenome]|uniref:Uncharacterized protein n=1 Tax=marine sediment metagenome TaxID=412755 RepID=A0A0F9HGK4_9ZZZZ|nr:hypothetical protein [bacterium]